MRSPFLSSTSRVGTRPHNMWEHVTIPRRSRADAVLEQLEAPSRTFAGSALTVDSLSTAFATCST